MSPSSARNEKGSTRLLLVVIPLAVLFASWILLGRYTSYAAQECYTQYRAARTAADSAVVDGLAPHRASDTSPEVRSCASIRTSARWW